MLWVRRFTEQGHRHGHQVILCSSGPIYRVFETLIEAGVDCLHSLQTRAVNMDAEPLARSSRGRIAFLGGIDTQHLPVHASLEEVKAEVEPVNEVLGPSLIVSASHGAILPDVPPESVQALAQAAVET